jgi:hypothetical protein
VQYLNEVLYACQNIRFVAAATVCDVVTNSVKYLKLLGATKRKPFFRFHNQETATGYNPLHLLKCTQNPFLKHNVDI